MKGAVHFTRKRTVGRAKLATLWRVWCLDVAGDAGDRNI